MESNSHKERLEALKVNMPESLHGLSPVEDWMKQSHYQDLVIEELRSQIEYLTSLIDTPHTDDFLKAIPFEAAHQVKRWGAKHDAAKEPTDWLWVVGYLIGKATNAAIAGDIEKAKHHTISTAAVCFNWFRHLAEEDYEEVF